MKVIVCAAVVILAVSSACADDEIAGKISALDAAAGTLEISGVKITCKAAVVRSAMGKPCSLSDLKAGESVDAEGTFSGPGEMTASEIEQELTVKDQAKGTIVSTDAAARTLAISGITVKVPEGARIEVRGNAGVGFAGIRPGARAECEGKWTGRRELTASEVDIE